MNPIPLAAPNGIIYAYACGHCHHVSAGASKIVMPETPGPFPELVEYSLLSAEQCCTCRSCGCIVDRGLFSLECEKCERWTTFVRSWSFLSLGYVPNGAGGPKICAICRSVETQWCRENPRCTDCADDHASNASGRCRDCDLDALTRGV